MYVWYVPFTFAKQFVGCMPVRKYPRVKRSSVGIEMG